MGKNIKKIWRAKDWRAAAYWLERNVPEFASKATPAQAPVTNNKGIIMDEETLKALSEAYDRRMKGES